VYIDRDRMRIEAGRGDESVLIIDVRHQRILAINQVDRTYQEFDREDIQALRDFAQELREVENRAFGRRTNQLSTEERKAEQALRVEMGLAGADSPPNLRFESIGEKRKVNGIACEMYRGLKFGKVWEEDCISPWDAGLFPRNDLMRMSKFLRESMKFPMFVETSVFYFLDLYPGFPVTRSLWPESPIPLLTPPIEVVKSVTRGPIPETKFSAPLGFKKEALKDDASGHPRSRAPQPHAGPPTNEAKRATLTPVGLDYFEGKNSLQLTVEMASDGRGSYFIVYLWTAKAWVREMPDWCRYRRDEIVSVIKRLTAAERIEWVAVD
jgi:hypothetical protein